VVRGLSRAKKGRDRTTLTPEVQTQLCVATERGDGGRRGLVSSWQPAWPRTGVLCQVLLLSQQSPLLLLLHHASLLWAKQAPDTGGQRASAGCCQLGRHSAAERCLSKQTAQRATAVRNLSLQAQRGPAPCPVWRAGTRVHTQTASHRGTAIPAGMLRNRPSARGQQRRINMIKVTCCNDC
ncbi:unnamed protein product, partial [Boreogadus saida]